MQNAKCKMQNQVRMKPFAGAKANFCGKNLSFYTPKMIVPYRKIILAHNFPHRLAVL